jgi:hypothetical protein
LGCPTFPDALRWNPAMSWNEAEILAARGKILKAAQDMLVGKLSYIEGARKIVAAGTAARLEERDVDLLPFVGIVSETDALPFGEMRKHWQAAALDALQPEIDEKEGWARGLANAIAKASSSTF